MLRLNRILKVRFQTIAFFLLCVCLVCSGIEKKWRQNSKLLLFTLLKTTWHT